MRYSDYNKADRVWRNFEKELGRPFTGTRLEYDMIKNINLISYKIIGALLLALSIVIILTVLYIISNTIKSSILSSYRIIGILKSGGFSPLNLISIYLIQYFILSIIFVLAGALLSSYTTQLILKDLAKALGIGNIPLSQTISSLVSVLFLIGFILLTTFFVARKAGKIKPAKAIRFGEPLKNISKGKIKIIHKLKKLPLTISLGVNNVLTDKLQSVFILLITIVISFILLFTVNFSDSLISSVEKGSVWGFSDSQISIERVNRGLGGLSHELALKRISSNRNVEEVVSIYTITNTNFFKPDGSSINVVGKAYLGDLNKMGYENIRGRHPVTKNEIALATNLSKTLEKKPGDMIEVYIEGQKMHFIVTGIYQKVNNFGREFRVSFKAVKAANPVAEPYQYAVLLKEGPQVKKVIEELKAELGGSYVVRSLRQELMRLFGKLLLYIIISFATVSFMFILLGIITIYNHTSVNVIKKKKKYGVIKALGMTPRQIRLMVVYRVLFITLMGIIISSILSSILSSRIALLIFRFAGLAHFPMEFNILVSLAAILIIIFINGISVWIASRRVMKLNVRNLIIE